MSTGRGDEMRIAIIKLGSIGDVVNSLPFLNALRRFMPGAHIDWLIEEMSLPILKGYPGIDQVLVHRRSQGFRGFFKAVRSLRRGQYDLVIDLQRIVRSGLLTLLSGSPRRLGFDRDRCKELSWLFTNEKIPPGADSNHIVDQYLEFVSFLGGHDTKAVYGLRPTEEEIRTGEKWFAKTVNPRIVVNVGATKPANLWPVEHWITLVDRIWKKFGCRPLLTGSGAVDRQRADAILSGTVHAEDAVGRMGLRELLGTLAVADLVISADTGPLHMAVAVGTPVAALFGAADSNRTGPYFFRDLTLVGKATCSPCRKRNCPVEGHPCMTSITPDMVMNKLESFLAGKDSRKMGAR